MSQPPSSANKSSTSGFSSDDKEFFNTYIDQKRGILIFSIILILFGVIMFLQMCGAMSSGSDPSGLAGSSVGSSNTDESDTLDPAVVGFFEFLAVVMIIIGVVLVVNIQTSHTIVRKLIADKDRCGAVSVYPATGKIVDDDLFNPQVAIWEASLVEKGIEPNSLVVLPPAMEEAIAARYATEDSSDSDSSSSEDTPPPNKETKNKEKKKKTLKP